jgi:hypothetical protein
MSEVADDLRRWSADAVRAAEALRSFRQRVEEQGDRLESPRAALEFIDFFTRFFTRFAAEFDRVIAGVETGIRPAEADAIRRLALASEAEARQCMLFSDKWISKPLPYEDMRPLLAAIHREVRDRLVDFRALADFAARLETMAATDPSTTRYDRRAFWSRLAGPLGRRHRDR